ncbi:biotin-dependent carboxyltransferase family protein [Shewanella sp. AS16]|uniref:5-oxoprolinase subunit C family protein n=1 Tax=Shewanella sp. AS16 TaxID=2907625 RepID=UPI001F41F336|nr:biotin-dependent carboxyltransferase family protein [Shewanella sp. AS16]MCE9688077.1 biotin-dependent carboxyltransferase family protein [Shewanella sp. AS16]
MLSVIEAGLLTTVQDLGRVGYRHLGVPLCGALDRQALLLANRLLANPDNAPVLEFSTGPVSLGFQRDSWISLTGADFAATIDGQAAWCGWRSKINAGQRLNLRGCHRGMRGYLAVDGGICVPLVMGSAATDLNAVMGGHLGRALSAGDNLPLGETGAGITTRLGAKLPSWSPHVRVLTTQETLFFTPESRQAFWTQAWRVSPRSNRMGVRLEGNALRLEQPLEMLSHAVMPGVIQVPPSGQPIVLLADAQTTGGYPKIAVVIEADLWKLAQARPGQAVYFHRVTQQEAQAATARWQSCFHRLTRGIDAN